MVRGRGLQGARMRAFVHKANRLLSGFAGWLMLAMMFLLITDIVFRSMDMPLHGLAELSVFVMMIVIYMGLARCEEHSEHVGLEFAINKCQRRRKKGPPRRRKKGPLGGCELVPVVHGRDLWAHGVKRGHGGRFTRRLGLDAGGFD